MPRNKYPEVTEKAILDTAKRLFLEHGYVKKSSINYKISRKIFEV